MVDVLRVGGNRMVWLGKYSNPGVVHSPVMRSRTGVSIRFRITGKTAYHKLKITGAAFLL